MAVISGFYASCGVNVDALRSAGERPLNRRVRSVEHLDCVHDLTLRVATSRSVFGRSKPSDQYESRMDG